MGGTSLKVLFTPFRDPQGYDILTHPDNVEEYGPPYDEGELCLIGRTKGRLSSMMAAALTHGLHRVIAESEMTQADVLRFAAEYGFLSMPELFPGDVRPAESYMNWVIARDGLAAFCRGLDLLGSPKAPRLDPLDSGLLQAARSNALDALRQAYATVDPYYDLQDLDGPENVLAMLRSTAEAALLAGTRVGLDFDSIAIAVRPIGLYGAAWLSATEELFGRKVARARCLGCDKWFVPEKPNQRYCPDTRDACHKKKQRR